MSNSTRPPPQEKLEGTQNAAYQQKPQECLGGLSELDSTPPLDRGSLMFLLVTAKTPQPADR
jgi:hypothetical protein